MASGVKPRVKVPKTAAAGSAITIKTLISHKMESGQRKDKKTGKNIPRNIINKFTATYGGNDVMRSVWHPAISANPYLAFFVVAEESGPMQFTWVDDDDVEYKKEIRINVT